MKIAKEFHWEMGHRLPFHKGKCVNLHGHTYRLQVIVSGTEDEHGLVIDFYDLKRIINPVIEKLDHSFMVSTKDTDLVRLFKGFETKIVLVDFHSTVENIAKYLLQEISSAGLPGNIDEVAVRVYETTDSYAEASINLNPLV